MASRRLDGARELITQRWSQIFAFDLAPETLDQLLAQNQPGVILEAIKLSRSVADPNPERAYSYFLSKLERTAGKYEPRGLTY